MDTPQPALTPQRAARALGISIDTLKRWEAEGLISSYRTEGGHRRFPQTEIQRLIDKRDTADRGAAS